MHQYDVADRQRITDFIPKGYKLFEKISGDLNKDGLEDCVLIIRQHARMVLKEIMKVN